jgi:signal transduction histidine kinase
MMLDDFIVHNRTEIIRRCRAKVASRWLPIGLDTVGESPGGVPLFLDQLLGALRGGPNRDIAASAGHHGRNLLRRGFSVAQVVHDYGDVCQTVTELAVETKAPIRAQDFRTLNRCLDEAIAGAVTEYGRARNQSTREGESARGSERLGFFAHELRNLTNTAIFAFEVLKTGNVGVAGNTGGVLNRSLMGIRALIGRALAEVRLTEGIQNLEQIPVSLFIEELGAAATLEANARNITLVVLPVDDSAVIEGDRQVLGAVVSNLLQNAFKFTRPGTTVTLRVGATAERVLLEIEDQCGGLPSANVDELFAPFEQRSGDRTGLGLGLAFSRWAVEANHGRVYARNLPERGCIFTVDLPRVGAPAAVVV